MSKKLAKGRSKRAPFLLNVHCLPIDDFNEGATRKDLGIMMSERTDKLQDATILLKNVQLLVNKEGELSKYMVVAGGSKFSDDMYIGAVVIEDYNSGYFEMIKKDTFHCDMLCKVDPSCLDGLGKLKDVKSVTVPLYGKILPRQHGYATDLSLNDQFKVVEDIIV